MTNRDRTADDEPGAAGTHGPPEEPFQLGARSWWRVLVRTVWEFDADHLFDWAAALTYYTILSIFPGLLLLVSVLGLVGQSVIDPLLDNLRVLTPEPARDILEAGARSLTEAQGTAGIFAFATMPKGLHALPEFQPVDRYSERIALLVVGTGRIVEYGYSTVLGDGSRRAALDVAGEELHRFPPTGYDVRLQCQRLEH